MSEQRKNAVEGLIWYFKRVFQKAGLPWDRDNDREIERIVDHIVQAAIEP